jgi:hypothetical protein
VTGRATLVCPREYPGLLRPGQLKRRKRPAEGLLQAGVTQRLRSLTLQRLLEMLRRRSTGSRRPLRPLMAQCYVPPLVVDEPLSSNPVSPRLSGVLNSPSDERYR